MPTGIYKRSLYCKRGHLKTQNMTKDGCRACKRMWANAKYWENPQAAREYSKLRARAQRKANPEKVKARKNVWREANSEKVKAQDRAWRKANVEQCRARAKAYGKANTERAIWRSMLHRCNSPKNSRYSYYGGAGVKVCRRWYKFENFISDLGKRPSTGHSLSRLADTGDYKLGNVFWHTRMQQGEQRRIKNQRRAA